MTSDELQKISSDLFNKFVNENSKIDGIYFSAQTNQILAFEKYIAQLNNSELFRICDISDADVVQLREFITCGIAKYFSDNIKTLAIL